MLLFSKDYPIPMVLFLILLPNHKSSGNGGRRSDICINESNINMFGLRSGSVRIDCIYSLRTRTILIQLFFNFLLWNAPMINGRTEHNSDNSVLAVVSAP
jgi:hypothetical protein